MVIVWYSDPSAAAAWRSDPAVQCNLQLCAERPTRLAEPALWLDGEGLWLLTVDGQPLRVEHADVARRSAASDLARACGIRPGLPRGAITVLDPMAGWGLDGLVLASLGARVLLVERSPVVALLLQDLVRRVDGLDAEARIGDGWLQLQTPDVHDIVYLDPMFPPRNKAALPKRPLQLLSTFAASDARPLGDWLQAARSRARDRVVLKRRLRDPLVSPPDWQIRGRRVRFDVYRGASAARARSTA
jgi:16S rRNA (guanine1516-N2)-methyltransferase